MRGRLRGRGHVRLAPPQADDQTPTDGASLPPSVSGSGEVQVDQGKTSDITSQPSHCNIQFGQIVFYFNLVYYCVFVGLISYFMVATVRPHDPLELASQAEEQDNNPKYDWRLESRDR